MKTPIKRDYETQQEWEERWAEYESHRTTVFTAYALSALAGIILGLLVIFVNWIWPR